MSSLKDLDTFGEAVQVVLLQTPADALRLFIQDKLKDTFNCDSNSIIKVENKKGLSEIGGLLEVYPFLAKKWLFIIELDKVGNLAEVSKLIDRNVTGVFLCVSERYGTFKRFKEFNKDTNGFVDLYLSSLRFNDMTYLYDYFVPEENRLSSKLYSYVANSYSNDITAVFDLFRELSQGTKFESTSDITSVCGIGGNTIEYFIMSLLKDAPKTEKGIKSTIKNRVKLGYDLSEVYSWDKLWAYSNNCIKSFSDIKMLVISGEVYKSIRQLPQGYDEKKLSRYGRYIYKLKDIPYSRVLRLRYMLGDTRWQSEIDFLDFVYKYYCETVKMERIDSDE